MLTEAILQLTLQPLLQHVQTLGDLLRQRQATITTAESCTGGLLAGTLTAVPGASTWFNQGFITYSNAAKTTQLGVPLPLLLAEGAVSEAVVRAMATGALARAQAQVAVAVSGIAGPDGGTPDKPVGTVCLAWAWQTPAGAKVNSTTQRFAGDRAAVRAQTIEYVLTQTIAQLNAERPD